ncbi:MAG: ABC transporter permease [Chloroflexi bacterium]|nr:ABC transporter permease [Chloroflexota bacterium]
MSEQVNVSSQQLVIEPTRGLASLKLRELWEYRELLYFLVWRDVKVRYKQTALGVAWVVLQPLVATLIFTVVFGNLARIPSGDLPYPLFAFSALLPWQYFAGALTRSGTSLVNSAHLITKIYFPRLIIPLAGILNGLIDFGISFLVLIVLMLYYGVVPGWAIVTLPLFLLMAIATALGVSLWLSALGVQYRDVNQLLPFLVQVWMYATPVVYPATLFPERWRPLLGLNPMAGVVEGFRWALTGSGDAPGPMLLISIAVVLVLLVSGLIFFRNTERTFADVV